MKNVLFVAAALFGLTACTEETIVAPTPFVPAVTTVSLNVAAAQIEVGRTINITATVKDQRDSVMTGKVVTWSSNNTPVATVANGIVTGVTKGQVTIVASVDGKVATATVFVTDASVNSVSLTAAVPTPFFVGQTVLALASPRDINNNVLSAYSVTWTSSNTAVATVSSTGLITAVSAGSATISASSSGKTATLVVNTSLVPVTKIALSLVKPSHVGRTSTISPTLTSSVGTVLTTTQRVFGWHSSDETVATVSETGVITGLTYGTTIVSCVVEGKVGVLVVNVTEVGIDHIIVKPDSADIKVGGTRQYVATAFDADSVSISTTALNGRAITWTIGNSAVAVVSNAGIVLGLTPGTTTVAASIGMITDNAKVVIVP